MNMSEALSRRAFLATVATGAGLGFRAQDSRLAARPYPPRRSPSVGETRFGEGDRGGVLYVPEGYDPERSAPLLVALHGAGGRAGNWRRFYETCEEHEIVLLAPDARGRTWDRVTGTFGPDVRFIDAALRHAFDRCVVDPARIALGGFSDGASYALSLGVSNGDLFSHLIAFSPGSSNPTEPIVGTPRVFVSHGTGDRILPVAASRRAIVPMFEMDGYPVE